MKRKLIYIFWCWLSSILLFMACDDMEDKPFTSGIIGDPTETGTAELYVLCEGLFNQNNSSLARFSFGNQQMVRDYFKAVIPRSIRLGEAPSFGHTIFEHDPSGAAADAYLKAAREFIKRHKP